MDALTALWRDIGPAGGAALVGLVWALVDAIKRRSSSSEAMQLARAKLTEARALSESTDAAALKELLAQMGDMREQLKQTRQELEQEKAARMKLADDFAEVRDDLETERRTRQHWESQAAILTQQLAASELRANELATQLRDLYRAIMSGNSKLTIPPPPGIG